MEEHGCMSKSIRPKCYNNGGIATNKTIINYRKDPVDSWWESSNAEGGDMLGEFPWPPRSYTCTFCKREFRSAQALGGHMNVHRREKARLRQMTPPKYLPFLPTRLNLDHQNPNPNPKISTTFASNTSSFPSILRSFPYSAPGFYKITPSTDSPNVSAMRSQKSDKTVDGFDDFSHEQESIVKKSEDGSLVASTFEHDLDLELRLGYS